MPRVRAHACRSGLPKVLHPIAGQAMVRHVIAAAAGIEFAENRYRYRARRPVVEDALAETGVQFAVQSPQSGNRSCGADGFASIAAFAGRWQGIDLYGDVPLIQTRTFEALLQAAGDGVGLITRRLTDPTGYGRIVRDAGEVVCNVEEKDATDEQRKSRK